jgi:hypothetical protein
MAALAVFVAGVSLLVSGCAAARQSTALTLDDMEVTAAELKTKLLDSNFMKGRGPDSPPIVIAIQKPQNLSRDIIPESEEWMLMQRIRQAAPIHELRQQKAIMFVIPAEQVSSGIDKGAFYQGDMDQRKPTHVMTATIRSATRQAQQHRTDLYQMELVIVELAGGEVVFQNSVEFKRVATGKAYD